MRGTRAIGGTVLGSLVCAAVAWGLSASEGCQLQTCEYDGGSTTLNSKIAGFQPTIENGVWQSAPLNGAGGWISFPGQAAFTVLPTLEDGGPFPGPYVPYALVSADPNPYTNSGSNFAPSAGNITEFAGNTQNDGINVFNDTCTQYYLWLQLTPVNPATPGTPSPLDASPDGPTSAATDASDDASSLDASIPAPDASNADATGD